MCSFDLMFAKGQLWAVVAMLATKTVDKKDTATFSELPYVQALQFSISSLKSAFNLQCKFEARCQAPIVSYMISLTFSWIFEIWHDLMSISEPGQELYQDVWFGPLSQGWFYGALCFGIACSRGSLGCHAVLHVAGVQKTWSRHQCRAAGKVIKEWHKEMSKNVRNWLQRLFNRFW